MKLCLHRTTLLAIIAATYLIAPLSSAEQLSIEGRLYEVALTKQGKYHDNGAHFSGAFTDGTSGWLRLSKLPDGSTRGIAVIDNEVHDIHETAAKAKSSPLLIEARSFKANTEFDHLTCGVDHTLNHDLSSTKKSQSPLQPEALTVEYSNLCTPANSVNGICNAANIEFIYDQSFIDAFPGEDAQTMANSLINMVEGYYENQFNIRLNVLTSTFLTTEDNTQGSNSFFSNTTSASSLLEEVFSRKCEAFEGLSSNCRSGNYVAKANSIPSSFLTKQRALTHFVTARDFDGSTAGVAFTNVFCRSSGIATATSQLLGSPGSIDLARSAAVIAHELGHNFGSPHDNNHPAGSDPSCNVSTFLMNPSLSSTAPSSFSSCSEDTMSATMASHFNNAQCFSTPLDLRISASSTTANGTENVSQTHDFSISATTAATAPTSTTVTATVTNGSIDSATLAGSACSVASNALSASCTMTNISTAQQLSVTFTPQLDATLSASISTPNDFADLVMTNNTQAITLTIADDPDFTPPVTPAPTPTPTVTPPSSSGSASWLFLALITALFSIRRRLA